MRALDKTIFSETETSSETSLEAGVEIETYGIFHYKLNNEYAAVAIAYPRHGGQYRVLLHVTHPEGVVAALEKLWEVGVQMLGREIMRVPLEF
jgi:hypothetical protein